MSFTSFQLGLSLDHQPAAAPWVPRVAIRPCGWSNTGPSIRSTGPRWALHRSSRRASRHNSNANHWRHQGLTVESKSSLQKATDALKKSENTVYDVYGHWSLLYWKPYHIRQTVEKSFCLSWVTVWMIPSRYRQNDECTKRHLQAVVHLQWTAQTLGFSPFENTNVSTCWLGDTVGACLSTISIIYCDQLLFGRFDDLLKWKTTQPKPNFLKSLLLLALNQKHRKGLQSPHVVHQSVLPLPSAWAESNPEISRLRECTNWI